jgi:membrane protease YdiL (CAAX protease family)
MTLIAWIETRLAGTVQVGPGIAWTSIILATLAFGALHLPNAMALMSLTLPIVAWVFLANGLAGVAFGWLYWRRGLLAAMVAHFATDLILHVLAPTFGLIS